MHERIEINPEIQHGRPVIRGTRVPVAMVLSLLAGGTTHELIATEYDITEADIVAVLTYAAELANREQQPAVSATS